MSDKPDTEDEYDRIRDNRGTKPRDIYYRGRKVNTNPRNDYRNDAAGVDLQAIWGMDGKCKRSVYLSVPFDDRGLAKLCGLWWEPNKKRWFIPVGATQQKTLAHPFKQEWMKGYEFKD